MKPAALLLALIAPAAVLAAGAPARGEFAYEAPIAAASSLSVLRVPLTPDVYRGVTRADLGDIRAYNAAGEMLAFSIERAPAESVSTTVGLPVFPVAVPTGASVEQLVNKVKRDADGAVVSVQTRTAQPDDRFVFLVDATAVKESLSALEVTVDGPAEYLGTLTVEASQDLRSWRQLAQGALASLARDDNTLRRDRIELPAHSAAKYLRLAWTDAALALKAPVTGVRGEIRKQVSEARDWLGVATSPGSAQGEYRFDPGGMMPIDRVRVQVPVNTVARVVLLSRGKGGERWIQRAQKTVFAVESAGTEVREDVLQFPRSAGHQWLLRVHKNGNGFGAQAPGLEVGWIPDHLLVVTRGVAPFTVAYGRAATEPADFGVADLVNRARRDGRERVDIGTGTLGTPQVLAGGLARELAWYQRNWKQWALWAVLVLGVAILGWFATRLVRQVDRQ